MGFGSRAIVALASVPRCHGATGEQADAQMLKAISSRAGIGAVFFIRIPPD